MSTRNKPTWEDMVREFMKETGQSVPNKLVDRTKNESVLRLNLLHREVAEVVKAERHGDMAEIANELVDVIYIAIGTSIQYGINVDDIFREVHRANMAKRFPDGEFHRDRGTGQILKHKEWTKPNVSKVLKGYKAPK